MSADVQIIGMDKLVYCLQNLPQRTSFRILITALKKAGKPVKFGGRKIVKKRTRNLMKSINIFPGKNKEYPAVWIAPTSGKKAGKFDGWYAHFVHFGTKGFGRRTSGNTTTGYSKKGQGLKANPFMTLGFEQGKNDSYNIIHQELSDSIVKFLQKNMPK